MAGAICGLFGTPKGSFQSYSYNDVTFKQYRNISLRETIRSMQSSYKQTRRGCRCGIIIKRLRRRPETNGKAVLCVLAKRKISPNAAEAATNTADLIGTWQHRRKIGSEVEGRDDNDATSKSYCTYVRICEFVANLVNFVCVSTNLHLNYPKAGGSETNQRTGGAYANGFLNSNSGNRRRLEFVYILVIFPKLFVPRSEEASEVIKSPKCVLYLLQDVLMRWRGVEITAYLYSDTINPPPYRRCCPIHKLWGKNPPCLPRFFFFCSETPRIWR